jgi:folate-dependent phosphoribosylglycinamide formyltransferase PurN
MYKIGWFSTGRGQGSLNLLNSIMQAINDKTVKAEISFVFCSRETGDAEGSDRFIEKVKEYGLDIVCFSSKSFMPDLRKEGKTNPEALSRWRNAYDAEIMKRLEPFQADITVLAGYMLVVGDVMCKKFDMVNLHPAAPDGPAGTWQEVIWQLISERSEKSGNMMHLVTEELDKGAPITYVTFPIVGKGFDPLWQEIEQKLKTKSLDQIAGDEGEDNSLFKKIRQDGAMRELPLVVQTVRAFAEGRIRLENRIIIEGDKVLQGPYCLTKEIEKQLG